MAARVARVELAQHRQPRARERTKLAIGEAERAAGVGERGGKRRRELAARAALRDLEQCVARRARRRLGRVAKADRDAFDERRRRRRAAGRIALCTREVDLRRRRDELSEQEALLLVSLRLDRQVGQHVAQRAAQRVGQQRIFRDAAREHAALEPDHAQRGEAARARLHYREHLDAAAAAAERIRRDLRERAPQHAQEVVAPQRGLARALEVGERGG